MEQQLIFSSPIHQGEYFYMDESGSNMGSILVASDECESNVVDKMAMSSGVSSSSRSPTCVVLAVDERLSDVFRVPSVADAVDAAPGDGDMVEDVDREEEDRRDHHRQVGGVDNDIVPSLLLRPSRCLTPSFATEEEIMQSTFSEDTDETSSSTSSISGDERHHRYRRYLPTMRRSRATNAPSLVSIFRPSTCGTKRRCDDFDDDQDEEDEEEEDRQRFYHHQKYRRSSDDYDDDDECGPSLLRRANPVGSGEIRDDGESEDECHHRHPHQDEDGGEVSLSSTYPFASAFKRICRSGSANSSAIAPSAIIDGGNGIDLVSRTTAKFERLQHPLSSMMTAITTTNEDAEYPRVHRSFHECD
jgi:hypothetical protein